MLKAIDVLVLIGFILCLILLSQSNPRIAIHSADSFLSVNTLLFHYSLAPQLNRLWIIDGLKRTDYVFDTPGGVAWSVGETRRSSSDRCVTSHISASDNSHICWHSGTPSALRVEIASNSITQYEKYYKLKFVSLVLNFCI